MRLPVALSLLALLLLLAIAAYLPGLHGNFLFDDFGNLPALGAGGPITNWPAFWRYVTSGTADPTGRPLTLLTFLIDARNWPAAPYPFKRTSLVLHLLNGALLYVLLGRLGRALDRQSTQVRQAALMGTALWLLHPLLVSTTLYIVQREAMLPATFVLMGLLLWLHGRSELAAGKVTRGLLWSVTGLGGFTVLGVLAKANGALLPMYALLIEAIVLASREAMTERRARLVHRGVMLLLAALPAVAVIVYLGHAAADGIMAGGNVDNRAWSTAQRLLTEPRVLVDYLTLLWFPRPFSTGLFNDQYIASTSWLHPLTTLPCILIVGMMLAGAWWARKRHPAFALAILFYFTGQLIESTALPLELYYEHRNYVPALLMFWPLARWLTDTRRFDSLKRILILALPLGLALMTHARAAVWGNEQTQAMFWARINPNSPRAQVNAAELEMRAGRPSDAANRLQKLLAAEPDQVQLVFNLIGAHCMMGGIHPDDLKAAIAAMQHTPATGALFVNWFERMLPITVSNECPGLTSVDLRHLIDAGLENPRLDKGGAKQDLIYLRGRIALIQHRPDAALADFQAALDVEVRPAMALEAAATLGSAGYPAEGLRLLDYYGKIERNALRPGIGMPTMNAWILARQDYWPRETARLRQQLTDDANTARQADGRSHYDRSEVH